jgi:hypothetical protein
MDFDARIASRPSSSRLALRQLHGNLAGRIVERCSKMRLRHAPALVVHQARLPGPGTKAHSQPPAVLLSNSILRRIRFVKRGSTARISGNVHRKFRITQSLSKASPLRANKDQRASERPARLDRKQLIVVLIAVLLYDKIDCWRETLHVPCQPSSDELVCTRCAASARFGNASSLIPSDSVKDLFTGVLVELVSKGYRILQIHPWGS